MQARYLFDRFEVRPAERLLLIDGVPAAVGARAFDLLLCLLEHRDRVMSKDAILDIVWPGLVVEENNLSVQVSSLRKLLGAKAIATVPGRGYRFALESLHDASLPRQPTANAETRLDRLEALARSGKTTIAVLPFNVLSDEPRLGFLADGLVEDIIALLARIPGFILISRASSFAFRGQGLTVPEVARQLGVRFVVEGSVRPKAAALRVTTHLIEAASGHVLWSGQFERHRDQAEDLQEDIARGVLSELEPELTRAEVHRVRRQRPENLDAWAHYRQAIGSIALNGWGETAMAEARLQLQQCVTVDPAFGIGHAQQALLTALSMNIALIPQTQERVEEATRSAQRALELDSGSSEVLGYAGCALCDLGQQERGIEVLQRALAIDPSNAQAHVAMGAALALAGKLEAGIEKMRYGMTISPRDHRLGFWGWALGLFLYRADRCAEALAEARLSSQRDPRFHLSRILEAATLDRLGRIDDVRGCLVVARQLSPALGLREIAWTHGRRTGERMAAYWETAT